MHYIVSVVKILDSFLASADFSSLNLNKQITTMTAINAAMAMTIMIFVRNLKKKTNLIIFLGFFNQSVYTKLFSTNAKNSLN